MASSSTGHSGRTEPPEGGRTPLVTLPSLLLGENGPQLGKGSTRHEKRAGGPKGGGWPGSCPSGCSRGGHQPSGGGTPKGGWSMGRGQNPPNRAHSLAAKS